jgi:formylglycine-generating enzyme required for sulfatase activity
MKSIPAGTIEMGPNKTKVTLDAFYIGVYEVTFDEFNCFREREQDNDQSENPSVVYKADAVTRPTPQYVNLTFGMGDRGGFPMVSTTNRVH